MLECVSKVPHVVAFVTKKVSENIELFCPLHISDFSYLFSSPSFSSSKQ
jgi:hypothetical protein